MDHQRFVVLTVDLLPVEVQRGDDASSALVVGDAKTGGVARRLVRAEAGEEAVERRSFRFHRRIR